MTDVESAKGLYTLTTSNLDTAYKDKPSTVIISNAAEDHGKYEMTSPDYYAAVCHKKNTVLYVSAYAKSKEDAEKILKELGY